MYLHLGQLDTGEESIMYYETALGLLRGVMGDEAGWVSVSEPSLFSIPEMDVEMKDVTEENNSAKKMDVEMRDVTSDAGEMNPVKNERDDSNTNTNPDLTSFKLQYSQTLCAMTEIYLTDLCDVPDAEQRCECYMTEALKVPTCDVFVTLASVRMSQERGEEARVLVEQGMDTWWVNGMLRLPLAVLSFKYDLRIQFDASFSYPKVY